MKKRVFSLILALALLCTLLPQVALPASAEVYSGACGENLTWNFNAQTGLLTISGYGPMTELNSSEDIPWHDFREEISAVSLPEGLTSICFCAFAWCDALTSVTIPASVTSIGSGAFFGCNALTAINVTVGNPNYVSVNGVLFNKAKSELIQYPAGKPDASYQIPTGVTDIGDYAFYGCDALTGVTIPNGVTSIGFGAFEGTAYYDNSNNWDGQLLYIGSWLIAAKEEIESAEIKQGTIGIADGMFSFCSALTGVTIPDSVTIIGDYTFDECSSLTSVTIPASVTSIGVSVFRACSSLTSVTIPTSVTSIGGYTFYGCSALSSVTIPNSVTIIGDASFWGCSSLISVTIPDSVTIIGQGAFLNCTSLNAINVASGNSNYSSINGVLFNKAKTVLIQHPAGKSETYYHIPTGTISIGYGAFNRCSTLSSVIIPDSVTSIGDYAFSRCSSLTSVTIPDSVTSIGNLAFGYQYDSGWNKVEGFTIYGSPGTAAETYALENDFRFLAADRFVDVTGNDYFFQPVMWAISRDPAITSGLDDTHFGPNNDCTREQIVTFLWAVYGKPEPNVMGTTFSDVASDAWYYKPVMWAIEYNFTSGMGDGSFGVGQPCTRAQAMTFLWAAQGKPEPASTVSPFSDVAIGDWFCKPILWAAENGITAGIGDGLFGVYNTCTRAQIITFLFKAYA